MDAHLPSLTSTAGEHGAEDRDVESALHGGECHLHVRGMDAPFNLSDIPVGLLVLAGTAAGSKLGAVVAGHVGRVHVDDAQQAATEHALPLALDDVLAVVAPQHSLGPPLLLEEGLMALRPNFGIPHPEDVEEVVLVPCLSDFLYIVQEMRERDMSVRCMFPCVYLGQIWAKFRCNLPVFSDHEIS